MTDLNLLYGPDESSLNYQGGSNDRNEGVYTSQISGKQLHNMASNNDDVANEKQVQQQMQQHLQQQLQQQMQQQAQQQAEQHTKENIQMQKQEPQVARKRVENNFMDRMNMKRSEVIKLALFSLVIVLGISIDRMLTHYIAKYIGDNVLTDFQEFILRISYPISIFLLLWIFKAV